MLLAACILLTFISVSTGKSQFASDPRETYRLTAVLASQPTLTIFAAILGNYTSLLSLASKGNCTGKDGLFLVTLCEV